MNRSPLARVVASGAVVAVFVLLSVCVAGCSKLTPPPATQGFPGPLPIKHWETNLSHGLPMSVYYPDTTPRQQSLPVVVFSAGWNQPRDAYSTYGEQLAQWGYICVIRTYLCLSVGAIGLTSPDYERDLHERQVISIIDWCAEENVRPGSPLFGMVDTTRAATAGHSQGGSISVGAAIRDSRIKAVVNLDAVAESPFFQVAKTLSQTDVASMWVAADKGCICSSNLREPNPDLLFDHAKTPSIEIIVHGAAHIDFLEESHRLMKLGQVVCGGGTADKNAVRAIAMRYMVAWFNTYVKGLPGYDSYYNGASSEQDVEQGLVSIRTKLPPPAPEE